MTINRRHFLTGAAMAAAFGRFGPIWAAAGQPSGNETPATIAECETLFFGASSHACARAWAKPDRTVILESSLLTVGEFSGALSPVELTTPRCEAAKAFVRRMEKEGLVANGKYHAPPVSDVIVTELLDRQANFFFNGTLVDVTRSDGRFCALVSGADGLNRIVANRIIDTTPVGWRDYGAGRIREKFLCAPLFGNPNGTTDSLRGEGYETFAGALPGEMTLKVKLAADADWHTARLKLYETYERFASGHGSGWQIGGEATQLGVVYWTTERISETTPDGILWHPAAQYPDLVSAFEEGAAC